MYDTLEIWVRPHQPLAEHQAFGSKLAEHILRIAGVLSLIENFESDEISAPIMQRALVLGAWYQAEYLRIAEAEQLDAEQTLAKKLLDWAQQYDRIYPALLQQQGPYGLRRKSQYAPAVRYLEDCHFLQRMPNGEIIDGMRRAEVWMVTKIPNDQVDVCQED